MHTFKRSAVLALAAVVAMAGCSGEDGKNGQNGLNGTDGRNAPIPAGGGLKLEIVSATAPASGQPTVRFKVSDAQGNPVDLAAELAAATLSPRWVISQLGTDNNYASLYAATKPGASYTNGAGATTAPALANATQAASPSVTAASYSKVADGEYTVTFATPATGTDGTTYAYTNAVASRQVLVGVWGTRTFGGTAYPAANTFAFIPAGGATTVRQVVTDDACNACHKHMAAHDSRRTVTLCLACHSPQTTDPESGNSVDMKEMIHKLHSGVAGYFIVGYRQSFMDFSSVVFPDLANGTKNCAMCHGAVAPTPSIAACKTCHSALSLTHGGGAACAGCHDNTTAPTVARAHSQQFDAGATKLVLAGRTLDITIDSIDASATAPTVTFTVKVDGVASAITRSTFCMLPAEATIDPTLSCGSLRFSIGGPTADFGSGVLNSAGSGYGYLQSPSFTQSDTNFALLTATGTTGQYTAPLVTGASLAKWTAAAGSSVGVGVEAYALEAKATASGGCGTGALTATPAESATCAVREWPQSPTAMVFAKIGATTGAVARRTITVNAKCNACHDQLGFHGGEARRTPEYCAICHHPNNVNDERTTKLWQFENTPGGAPNGTPYKFTPNSVSIMSMAHKIHAGGALANKYVLGSDRSLSATHYEPNVVSTATFAGAFPGDLGDCQTCHAAGTYALPKATNLPLLQVTYTCMQAAPTATTANYCGNALALWPAIGTIDGYGVQSAADVTLIAPQTAACTSCHDSDAAKGHALLNTTAGGVETCAVCHGAGTTYDALEVHQPKP